MIERRLVAVCFSLLLLINWIDIRSKGSLKKKNAGFIVSYINVRDAPTRLHRF